MCRGCPCRNHFKNQARFCTGKIDAVFELGALGKIEHHAQTGWCFTLPNSQYHAVGSRQLELRREFGTFDIEYRAVRRFQQEGLVSALLADFYESAGRGIVLQEKNL